MASKHRTFGWRSRFCIVFNFVAKLYTTNDSLLHTITNLDVAARNAEFLPGKPYLKISSRYYVSFEDAAADLW